MFSRLFGSPSYRCGFILLIVTKPVCVFLVFLVFFSAMFLCPIPDGFLYLMLSGIGISNTICAILNTGSNKPLFLSVSICLFIVIKKFFVVLYASMI